MPRDSIEPNQSKPAGADRPLVGLSGRIASTPGVVTLPDGSFAVGFQMMAGREKPASMVVTFPSDPKGETARFFVNQVVLAAKSKHPPGHPHGLVDVAAAGIDATIAGRWRRGVPVDGKPTYWFQGVDAGVGKDVQMLVLMDQQAGRPAQTSRSVPDPVAAAGHLPARRVGGFNFGGPPVDVEAELAARNAVRRAEASPVARDFVLRHLELRHALQGGWIASGLDVATGTRVSVDSRRWPDAERDAWLRKPEVRAAFASDDPRLPVSVRGRMEGREFVAGFAEVGGAGLGARPADAPAVSKGSDAPLPALPGAGRAAGPAGVSGIASVTDGTGGDGGLDAAIKALPPFARALLDGPRVSVVGWDHPSVPQPLLTQARRRSGRSGMPSACNHDDETGAMLLVIGQGKHLAHEMIHVAQVLADDSVLSATLAQAASSGMRIVREASKAERAGVDPNEHRDLAWCKVAAHPSNDERPVPGKQDHGMISTFDLHMMVHPTPATIAVGAAMGLDREATAASVFAHFMTSNGVTRPRSDPARECVAFRFMNDLEAVAPLFESAARNLARAVEAPSGAVARTARDLGGDQRVASLADVGGAGRGARLMEAAAILKGSDAPSPAASADRRWLDEERARLSNPALLESALRAARAASTKDPQAFMLVVSSDQARGLSGDALGSVGPLLMAARDGGRDAYLKGDFRAVVVPYSAMAARLADAGPGAASGFLRDLPAAGLASKANTDASQALFRASLAKGSVFAGAGR